MVSFALHGVGVSGGIAIGRAQLVSHATLEVAHYTIPARQVAAEIERFNVAVKEVQQRARGPARRDDRAATCRASSARSSTCTG